MIPKYLPQSYRIELARQAREAQRLERIWRNKLKQYYEEVTRSVLKNAGETGRIKESLIDFEPFVMRHLFEVTKLGYQGAHRLSNKQPVPQTLGDLIEVWKAWRKGRKIPKRQRAIARKLKTEYLKRIHSIWKRAADPFLRGNSFDQQKAKRAIEAEVGNAFGRASTTVNTETTRYYNEARRTYYDRMDDVTHYLFLCIRDHRTTRWCITRAGLVYAKGDPLLDKETPPIHWNCRSELAPLTPSNPAHKRIIDNEQQQRRRHTCEPLPKNWRNHP